MRQTITNRTTLMATSALLLSGLATSAQAELGQELHEANCISCHADMMDGEASKLYTRSDRMIDNRDSLETQVQRCVTNLDLDWFPDEVEAVADYLAETHYDF
ncbi:MAG: cytochrome c [Pseudomonadota bacterium]